MIRAFRDNDLDNVMQIWLDTNIRAHTFIPQKYWKDNFEAVRKMMPKAELYVYGNDDNNQIDGFIGLMEDYIAGVFVREAAQSKGIGKKLLGYVKKIKPTLRLSVYEKNIRAIHFYQREGFVFQSESIDENTGEKEFVMVYTQRKEARNTH